MPRATLALVIGVVLLAASANATLGAPRSVAGVTCERSALALMSSLDARDELLANGEAVGGGDGGKHPGKMLLLSLAVPGAGQLAQGQKRGYLYLLAEAVFWGGFYVLDKSGLAKRDDYEDFADLNWQLYGPDGYLAFYQENCLGCPDDCEPGCRPLAELGSQEFYEDIGKYSVYWPWWDAGDDGGPYESTADDLALRNDYWAQRGESNRDLRRARYLMTAAFLNHIVSAIDAFFTGGGADSSRHGEVDLSLEVGVPDASTGLSFTLLARY